MDSKEIKDYHRLVTSRFKAGTCVKAATHYVTGEMAIRKDAIFFVHPGHEPKAVRSFVLAGEVWLSKHITSA